MSNDEALRGSVRVTCFVLDIYRVHEVVPVRLTDEALSLID